MTRIKKIEIGGTAELDEFSGSLEFGPGLNIVSAKNSYGKSLAVTSMAWCLGLEPMFGLQQCDPSRFPLAVKKEIKLHGKEQSVNSSFAKLELIRDDGKKIRIERGILDPEGGKTARIKEWTSDEADDPQQSKLQLKGATLKDPVAGFQRFLFNWLGLPISEVLSTDSSRGSSSRRVPLYLENLAPLFFIDQNEGWVDLQALQVFRYRQQEVQQASFEYLLGAFDALDARLAVQEAASVEQSLNSDASSIASRVEALFSLRGYSLTWTSRGKSPTILKRWKKHSLRELAYKEFSLDIASEQTQLRKQAEALRLRITQSKPDTTDLTASNRASQRVIELKTTIHERKTEFRSLTIQRQEQERLLKSLESRIRSSEDVLRLKESGVGRLERVECPTCHRHLDPESFNISEQSTEGVRSHIAALQRDRALIRDNLTALGEELNRVRALLTESEEEFRSAQRALSLVNQATDTAREQLADAASQLVEVERKIDRNSNFSAQIDALQKEIDEWISRAENTNLKESDSQGLPNRMREFNKRFRTCLLALGHSAVTSDNSHKIYLEDERYIPQLGVQRLRSLGSASDLPRMILAYAIALASTGVYLDSPHPGFVIVDEPLQQNPDTDHRNSFIEFLGNLESRQQLSFQLIVITDLRKSEIERLAKMGVTVKKPQGDFLLTASPKEIKVEAEEKQPDSIEEE